MVQAGDGMGIATDIGGVCTAAVAPPQAVAAGRVGVDNAHAQAAERGAVQHQAVRARTRGGIEEADVVDQHLLPAAETRHAQRQTAVADAVEGTLIVAPVVKAVDERHGVEGREAAPVGDVGHHAELEHRIGHRGVDSCHVHRNGDSRVWHRHIRQHQEGARGVALPHIGIQPDTWCILYREDFHTGIRILPLEARPAGVEAAVLPAVEILRPRQRADAGTGGGEGGAEGLREAVGAHRAHADGVGGLRAEAGEGPAGVAHHGDGLRSAGHLVGARTVDVGPLNRGLCVGHHAHPQGHRPHAGREGRDHDAVQVGVVEGHGAGIVTHVVGMVVLQQGYAAVSHAAEGEVETVAVPVAVGRTDGGHTGETAGIFHTGGDAHNQLHIFIPYGHLVVEIHHQAVGSVGSGRQHNPRGFAPHQVDALGGQAQRVSALRGHARCHLGQPVGEGTTAVEAHAPRCPAEGESLALEALAEGGRHRAAEGVESGADGRRSLGAAEGIDQHQILHIGHQAREHRRRGGSVHRVGLRRGQGTVHHTVAARLVEVGPDHGGGVVGNVARGHRVHRRATHSHMHIDVVDIDPCHRTRQAEGDTLAVTGIGSQAQRTRGPRVGRQGDCLQRHEGGTVARHLEHSHLERPAHQLRVEAHLQVRQAVYRRQGDPGSAATAVIEVEAVVPAVAALPRDVAARPAPAPGVENGGLVHIVDIELEILRKRQSGMRDGLAGGREAELHPVAHVRTAVRPDIAVVLLVGLQGVEVEHRIVGLHRHTAAGVVDIEIHRIQIHCICASSHIVGRPRQDARRGGEVLHPHIARLGTRRLGTPEGDHQAAVGHARNVARHRQAAAAHRVGVERRGVGPAAHQGYGIVVPPDDVRHHHQVERTVAGVVLHVAVVHTDVAVLVETHLVVEVVGAHVVVLHMLELHHQHLAPVVGRLHLPPATGVALRHLPVHQQERHNDARARVAIAIGMVRARAAVQQHVAVGTHAQRHTLGKRGLAEGELERHGDVLVSAVADHGGQLRARRGNGHPRLGGGLHRVGRHPLSPGADAAEQHGRHQ